MQINVTIIQDGKQTISTSHATIAEAAKYLVDMIPEDEMEDVGEREASDESGEEAAPISPKKKSFLAKLFNV